MQAQQVGVKSRESKTDFTEHYQKHRRILEESCQVNIQAMIDLRRAIHKHPEGGFQEFETQKKIKAKLLEIGIDESCIKPCAGTGLVVDLRGSGPESKEGPVSAVALRADMDGLPIPENNPHLDYKSTTDFAHLCGHDGHMATITSCA